jgi:hypothetical protein
VRLVETGFNVKSELTSDVIDLRSE